MVVAWINNTNACVALALASIKTIKGTKTEARMISSHTIRYELLQLGGADLEPLFVFLKRLDHVGVQAPRNVELLIHPTPHGVHSLQTDRTSMTKEGGRRVFVK